jgi:hypothetical protein
MEPSSLNTSNNFNYIKVLVILNIEQFDYKYLYFSSCVFCCALNNKKTIVFLFFKYSDLLQCLESKNLQQFEVLANYVDLNKLQENVTI